jgi:hypothetical protein
MKKIVSFGDSFIQGSEIPGNVNGSCAWPSLIAKSIGAEYKTFADPGCGNDNIGKQIYEYFCSNPAEDTLAVINWTWISRWDLYLAEYQTWLTLGPTCDSAKLKRKLNMTNGHELVDFYQKYANGSLLWNKFRCLQTIFAAQQYMKIKGIRSVQTYMDHHLFATEWHAPDYVRELQDLVREPMLTWDGQNFLDWSYRHGHEVTAIGIHPLQSAHDHAAKFWKELYVRLLSA